MIGKIDINAICGVEKMTALCCAVQNNQKKIVLMLLKDGADPFIPDVAGITAIQYADLWNKVDLLPLLSERTV